MACTMPPEGCARTSRSMLCGLVARGAACGECYPLRTSLGCQRRETNGSFAATRSDLRTSSLGRDDEFEVTNSGRPLGTSRILQVLCQQHFVLRHSDWRASPGRTTPRCLVS